MRRRYTSVRSRQPAFPACQASRPGISTLRPYPQLRFRTVAFPLSIALRSFLERLPQKFPHRGGDLREVRFERKMPRLQELNRRVWVVSQECLGARRNEIWIEFAPHGQEGRLRRSKVLLKLRV